MMVMGVASRLDACEVQGGRGGGGGGGGLGGKLPSLASCSADLRILSVTCLDPAQNLEDCLELSSAVLRNLMQ